MLLTFVLCYDWHLFTTIQHKQKKREIIGFDKIGTNSLRGRKGPTNYTKTERTPFTNSSILCDVICFILKKKNSSLNSDYVNENFRNLLALLGETPEDTEKYLSKLYSVNGTIFVQENLFIDNSGQTNQKEQTVHKQNRVTDNTPVVSEEVVLPVITRTPIMCTTRQKSRRETNEKTNELWMQPIQRFQKQRNKGKETIWNWKRLYLCQPIILKTVQPLNLHKSSQP